MKLAFAAFARLPAEIRQMLAHLPAAQAVQTVVQTGQPVLASPYSAGYTSASAGARSFPPLSPPVAPPPPPFLR